MRLYKTLTLLFCLVLLLNKTIAQELSDTTEVLVLKQKETLPPDAKYIGKIKITDKGFKTNCDYDQTIEQAKRKARAKGADIIKIIWLKEPSLLGSTCYRLYADVYYMPDVAAYISNKEKPVDEQLKDLLPDTASYALLYIYRPSIYTGSMIQYNLHVNDSEVCRVANGSRCIVKLTQAGKTKLWARTESRAQMEIDVKPGKVYFLKCGIKMGIMVGEPDMNLIDPSQGLAEFNRMRSKISSGLNAGKYSKHTH